MIRERNKNVTMSWILDISDWPREYASDEEPRTLPPPRL